MRLDELANDAHDLSVDDFRARHGDAFLLGIKGMLRAPKRFEETHSSPVATSVATPSQPVEWLVLPVRKQERSLSLSKITVGRTHNNDIAVEDPSVSRLHAFFEQPTPTTWTVRDAGAKTRTLVNGAVVSTSASPIHSGDEVQFGDVAFTFMAVDSLVYFVTRMAPRKT